MIDIHSKKHCRTTYEPGPYTLKTQGTPRNPGKAFVKSRFDGVLI